MMDPNRPAFPATAMATGGLNVREYIATHILAGLLSTKEGYDAPIEKISEWAVAHADALMDALDKE